MPMDQEERDAMDLLHAMYYLLLDKKRYLAPIPTDRPQKVLELGCATGSSHNSILHILYLLEF